LKSAALLGDPLGAGGVEVDDDNLGAGPGEPRRAGRADAARAAGDDGDSVLMTMDARHPKRPGYVRRSHIRCRAGVG